MISGSVFCSSSQYFHIGVFSCVMQETKARVEKLAIIVFLVLHPEEKCSGYETSGADPVVLFILSIFFICGIVWVIVTLKKKHGTAILIRDNDLFSRFEHQKKDFNRRLLEICFGRTVVQTRMKSQDNPEARQ